MKAFTVGACVSAAAVATILGATPAQADPGPTVINARCDDKMVSQPDTIIPNCAAQATKLTGMRWISWSGGSATGYGTQNGPMGNGPVFVTLDQPSKQITGQLAFTHASVRTLSGQVEQFPIAPMWAQ